jgi:flagellar biosynthesis protein FlgN
MTQTTLTLEIASQHIKQDVANCHQLLELLASEQHALKSRNPELLEDIIRKKSAALSRLEQNAKLRGQWIAQMPKADQKAESLWLTLLQHLNPKLKSEWVTLKQLFIECQNQNEINGKLLARNQQIFGRILAVIRGQYETAPLYKPNGSQGAENPHHRLGEA